MAVYTRFTAEAFSEFLSAYDIGCPLELSEIADGVENSNYALNTDKGRFVLTLFEKRTDPSELPYFVGLMEHLGRKGFPCPLPVSGMDGSALHEIADKPALIVTFLEGVSLIRPTEEHCYAIGATLAEMHAMLADFPLHRSNQLGFRALPRLFLGKERSAEALKPGMARIMDGVIARLHEHDALISKLPRGTIHADLFPDNAFFLNSEVSGVIDFYFACTGPLSLDLAICLNAWAFKSDGEYSKDNGRALIDGYESVRPLTALEKKAFPVLALGAATRFFLTRLSDLSKETQGALVTPKNPREYADRIDFHTKADGFETYFR